MRVQKWIHRIQGFIVGIIATALIAFAVVGGLVK